MKKSIKKTSQPKNLGKAALVGRKNEGVRIHACLRARKNVLLEGPVGVGKTQLALAVIDELKLPVFRVDGDSRYTEQKLSGWFDPPTVMKKGFHLSAFILGPLVEAMRAGGVLFINELNRLPEGVQNVLLPAIDEKVIHVPKLGAIKAAKNFLVIATQNPKEFVATSHLSEAILDRFELVTLDYQTEEEEILIVSQDKSLLAIASVKLVRLTRDHPQVRRGASVRAAISVFEIASSLIKTGESFEQAFLSAALMALPTRIEIEQDLDYDGSARAEAQTLISGWVKDILAKLESSFEGQAEDQAEKKKKI